MRLAAGRLAGDNPEEKKSKKKEKWAGCRRLTLSESRSYIHQRPLPRVAHYSLISTRSPSQDIHTSGDRRRRRKRELGNGEMKMEEEVRMETKKNKKRKNRKAQQGREVK